MRIFKTILCFLALFACERTYALPLGNPAEASLLHTGSFFKKSFFPDSFPLSFRFGYWGSFVFNRFLETSPHGMEIENTDNLTNALYFAVNYNDAVDLFMIAGTSRFLFNTNASVFGGPYGSRFCLETDTGQSWGVGGRWTFWEKGPYKAGVVGQYFFSSPQIERITIADTYTNYADFMKFSYHEWEIGLGAVRNIDFFSVYLGIVCSGVFVDLNHNPQAIGPYILSLCNLKSRKHLGLATGITMLDSDKMNITVEVRLFDENSVYINRQIRF